MCARVLYKNNKKFIKSNFEFVFLGEVWRLALLNLLVFNVYNKEITVKTQLKLSLLAEIKVSKFKKRRVNGAIRLQ